MNDGGSADQRQPGLVTNAGRPPRRSWPRRLGLALLATVWVAWFVIGLVVWLASSMALGDHSGSSSTIWLLLIIWIVPLGIIGATIIWFTSRATGD